MKDETTLLGDTGQQADDVDDLVATALHQLSLEEREQLLYDQHGVADGILETPELVASHMSRFQTELSRRLASSKLKESAIQLAVEQELKQQDRSYDAKQFSVQNDSDVILSFLRAERFHVKHAVARYIRYFDFRFYCYGNEKLRQRHVEQSDLDAEDLAAFRQGFLQVLPSRDRTGRAVCVFIPSHLGDASPKTVSRLFLHLVGSRDRSMLEKGVVLVVYHLGKFHRKSLDRKMMKSAARAVTTLPVRFVSLQHCLSDFRYRFVMSVGMRLLAREIRAKSKLHMGTPDECKFALMTYGIPAHLIPVGSNEKIKLKNHFAAMEYRNTLEEFARSCNDEIDWIEVPRNEDVLLGKGKPIQQHLGNMRLNLMVDDQLDRYIACGTSKKEKRAVVEEVVRSVKASFGRFVSQESGVWIEIQDDIAYEKVIHLFRNRKKANLATMSAKVRIPVVAEEPRNEKRTRRS